MTLSTARLNVCVAPKVLQEHAPNLVGEYILAFHAIELAFKAFPGKRRVSNAALAVEYGHNLVKLCEASRERGCKA